MVWMTAVHQICSRFYGSIYDCATRVQKHIVFDVMIILEITVHFGKMGSMIVKRKFNS